MPCEQYIRRHIDGKTTRQSKHVADVLAFKDDRELVAYLISKEQGSVASKISGDSVKRE